MVRIGGFIAMVLAVASISHAQTVRVPFSGMDSRKCMPAENELAKKQAELMQIHTRIGGLQQGIAVLRDGIAQQQDIASLGRLHAGMGAAAGVAKVTKAMSDTFLNITESAAPMVKRTYDAADSAVTTGIALYQGKGLQATAGALKTVQTGTEAYVMYVDLQDPSAILPQKPQTPGVIAAAVRSTDSLRRGDAVGAASHLTDGLQKLIDPKVPGASQTKRFLRASSKAASAFSDTPGKTIDSRLADELTAVSEFSRPLARAIYARGAGDVAAMTRYTGRIVGHSGMMLEQVSRAKEGLSEASAMYEEYHKIGKRADANQRSMQREIDKKYDDLNDWLGKDRKLRREIDRAVSDVRACRQREATRVASADGRSRDQLTARAPVRSTYRQSSWDRQAKKQQIDRLREERRRQIIDRAASGRTMGNAVIRPATPEANPNFASGSSYRDGTPAPAPPARPQYDSVKKCNHGDDCPNQ